jgi:hypothetical protein
LTGLIFETGIGLLSLQLTARNNPRMRRPRWLSPRAGDCVAWWSDGMLGLLLMTLAIAARAQAP